MVEQTNEEKEVDDAAKINKASSQDLENAKDAAEVWVIKMEFITDTPNLE